MIKAEKIGAILGKIGKLLGNVCILFFFQKNGIILDKNWVHLSSVKKLYHLWMILGYDLTNFDKIRASLIN